MEAGFEGPEPVLMDLLPASTFSAGGQRGWGSPCSSLPFYTINSSFWPWFKLFLHWGDFSPLSPALQLSTGNLENGLGHHRA